MTHATDDSTPTLRRAIAVGLSLMALALAGAGCGDDDGGNGGGGGGGATDEAPATQTTPADGGGGDAEDDGGAAGDQTAGATVFEENCAVCHGPGGEGGSGPDLRNDRYRDASVVEGQVINGGGGMPPFGDDLTDQQIADVVAYVSRDIAAR